MSSEYFCRKNIQIEAETILERTYNRLIVIRNNIQHNIDTKIKERYIEYRKLIEEKDRENKFKQLLEKGPKVLTNLYISPEKYLQVLKKDQIRKELEKYKELKLKEKRSKKSSFQFVVRKSFFISSSPINNDTVQNEIQTEINDFDDNTKNKEKSVHFNLMMKREESEKGTLMWENEFEKKLNELLRIKNNLNTNSNITSAKRVRKRIILPWAFYNKTKNRSYEVNTTNDVLSKSINYNELDINNDGIKHTSAHKYCVSEGYKINSRLIKNQEISRSIKNIFGQVNLHQTKQTDRSVQNEVCLTKLPILRQSDKKINHIYQNINEMNKKKFKFIRNINDNSANI